MTLEESLSKDAGFLSSLKQKGIILKQPLGWLTSKINVDSVWFSGKILSRDVSHFLMLKRLTLIV